MMITRTIKFTSLVVLALALLSCTFGPRPTQSTAPVIEGMLLDAGFVRNQVDTPEKMERVRAEVQRKVISVEEDGQTYYIYADADFCRCLYVGDETAFNRFEDMMYRKNLERNSCIDDRLRSTQAEPWREFGGLGSLCGDRP